ncbi:putative xyloglucan endotransglucosylase/hydrolase protein 23 [Acorus gramineus]|uniref:Xyloglucan endotransglucosylase/hydrolase n=1 Tax=Acorus gramineus TaxID=55184 RepID=A0AAV9BJF7_ACOGR|nr:putative xyloglucan endotransglucosylase/hydrolase protein 23 [Acorus gramineus]
MAANNPSIMLTVLFIIVSSLVVTSRGNNFYQDFEIVFGGDRVRILDTGELVTLSLDNSSGSGFQSINEYLFGWFNMQIKLVHGNSAGTVTAYYLQSPTPNQDEIDFEFLGNLSGDPYAVQTNVYVQGEGSREQQFNLWFDPTKDFHNYTILWNPKNIIFYVDHTPIRVFKNHGMQGLPYPKTKTMRLYTTIWNGEDWATRGGLIKTNWACAPFVASFRNFSGDACVWPWARGSPSCTATTSPPGSKKRWFDQVLDPSSEKKMKLVRKKYMIYDYCNHAERFHGVLPPECMRA